VVEDIMLGDAVK